MTEDRSLHDVCSELHTFLETKTNARTEFINNLIKSFPREKNDVAPFIKGDVGPGTLAKWVLAHPTCIPLLTKCLEKNDPRILERLKTKAKVVSEYRASASKKNTDAMNFFKVWGKDYANGAEGTALERISKLEEITNFLVQHSSSQDKKLDAQQVHIGKQDKKIQLLVAKIESLEQEIRSKDEQIKTLTEENQKLTADKQALERKIEELEKDKKVLEESWNDFRQKLEKEKLERQAEKERMPQDKWKFEQNNEDLDEIEQSSDIIDPLEFS